MRILRIGLQNLNSLLGKQEIDFRREPLASAGLYAIVGPTGAGKSTLLDAITLALYGKTERDATGAETMSHGTGECYAEVEYETDSGTYLSRWERRRARQKPDGNLQTAQRVLSKWDARAQRYVPVAADKLLEVNRRTVEVVGLDYNRFVRSVMLTQGQFARFLLSTVDERADVLEKITGTEIYRQLSTAAFERHREAREELATLRSGRDHTRPLAAEERAQLEREHTELRERTSHLRTRLNELRRRLERHRVLATTREKLAAATADLTDGNADWAATADRRTALQRSLDLAELRLPLATAERLTAEREREAEQLLKEEATLRGAEEAAAAAEATLARAAEAWETFAADHATKLALLERSDALDRRLEVLLDEDRRATARRTELAQQLAARERSLDELARTAARLTAELGDEPPADLEERIEARTTERLRLVGEMETIGHQLQFIRSAARLEAAIAAHAAAGETLATARGAVAEAEAEVESRRRLLVSTEHGAGAEHLRAALAPGAPCPVCGSTEHPAASSAPLTAADVERARRDLEIATRELAAARAVAERALTDLGRLEEARQEAEQRHAEMRELAGPLPHPEDPAAALRQTEARERTVAAEVEGLRARRTAARELLQLQPRRETEERELAAARTAQAEIDRRAAEGATERERLVAERETLIGQRTTAECRAALGARETKLRTAHDRAREAAAGHRRDLAVARSQVEARRDRTVQLATALTAAETELGTLLAELGTDAATARAALLPPAREEEERRALRELEVRLATARERETALREEVERLRSALRGEPAAEDLTAELTAAETEISTLDQELGGLRTRLAQDDERRAASARLTEELAVAETELLRWARLNELIGQQNGVKFSRFAQTLTLQRLAEVGNRHLATISDRYRMRHRAADRLGRENLELEIIDAYQNDNPRPMATLSGGETFLVSLALALGLSELAGGRTDIRSLFIDEGFGTLDDQALDQAVTALEHLERQDKKIGLISHVKELRERIHCQIRLEPRGNGHSRIQVVAG